MTTSNKTINTKSRAPIITGIKVFMTSGEEGVAFVEMNDRATAILDFNIDSFGKITLTKESERHSCFNQDGRFLDSNYLHVIDYIDFELNLF